MSRGPFSPTGANQRRAYCQLGDVATSADTPSIKVPIMCAIVQVRYADASVGRTHPPEHVREPLRRLEAEGRRGKVVITL
jgi:hypothetical protein